MNFFELREWLMACEGFSAKPYQDTVGKWTIGHGRNISDRKFSLSEIRMLLDNDLNTDRKKKLLPNWWVNIEEVIDYFNERPLTLSEAKILLENDIGICQGCLSFYKWYSTQSISVKCALINMCFMGVTKLLEFKKMITALEEKNYTKAAQEALNSKWATQVGKRAKDVALLLQGG